MPPSPGNSEQLARLAAAMPDAWPIFFRQRRPRPIQSAAMPLIVRGESVLLSSPTASGKTEAVIAPLFQRHVSFRRNRLAVLHVAPTKALANDLYYRLDDYLGGQFQEAVRRYTGDRHDFSVPEGVFVLLTTPEALDSLALTRPGTLAGVRAVVVDEIHMLHGVPRGQQLRHVLQRIRAQAHAPRDARDTFHVIGMTATLDDLEEVGRLWLGEGAKTVSVGEPRVIDLTLVPAAGDTLADAPTRRTEAIARWLERSSSEKVLVFGNTRNSTHAMAAALNKRLRGNRWPVYMHIGILSSGERERVEAAMREGLFGLCVATSTLEIGIDIGSIDTIVLAEPPETVVAFLQRIGRGNRRDDVCRVIAIHTDLDEEILYRALLRCASGGIMDDAHEYDRPSVRFQQIFSHAWNGVRLEKPLSRSNINQRSGGEDHSQVLEDMLFTGSLRDLDGALVPNDELMDEGDARRIHTVITGSTGFHVIDGVSGDVVASSDGGQFEEGLMYIGGRMRRLIESASGELYLDPQHVGNMKRLAKLPSARGREGLPRRVVWAIAELRGENPRLWYRARGRLTTWGGLGYNRLLSIVLRQMGLGKKITADDYSVSGLPDMEDISPAGVSVWAEELYRAGRIPTRDAAWFRQPSRYFSHLSSGLQATEVVNAVPLRGFLRWLDECEIPGGTT